MRTRASDSSSCGDNLPQSSFRELLVIHVAALVATLSPGSGAGSVADCARRPTNPGAPVRDPVTHPNTQTRVTRDLNVAVVLNNAAIRNAARVLSE